MQARVNIAGTFVDYEEVKSLPLSFSKGTDEYLDIIGSKSVVIDNAARRLMLPASKPVLSLFDQPHQPASDTIAAQARKPITVTRMGRIMYRGFCCLRQVLWDNGQVSAVGLELYANADDFFGKLGISLRELPLPTIELYRQTALDSMFPQALGFTTAPVAYAQSQEILGDHYHGWENLRPHVYFTLVIQAIENHTGYSIKSNFFDTDYFKNYLYLFSVGEEWGANPIRADRYDAAPSLTETNASDDGVWKDLPTVSINVWEDGNYNVWFYTDETIATELRFVATDGQTLDIPVAVLSLETQFLFEWSNVSFAEGVEIKVQYATFISAAGATADVLTPIYIELEKREQVQLSKCLHDKPVVDFLRGLQHMFNLAWFPDPQNQTVTVEPRHPYTLPDGTEMQGFYFSHPQSEVQEPDDWTSLVEVSEIELEYERPFGDALTLIPREEDSEAYERAKGEAGEAYYQGAKFAFPIQDEKPEILENPFFQGAVTVRLGFHGKMILIDDELKLNEGLTEGSFKSGPKWGYYAGNFGGNYQLSWRIAYRHSTALRDRPVIYQRPFSSIDQWVTPVTNASYNDFHYGANPQQTAKGLVSMFYPQTLACLEKALVLRVQAKVDEEIFWSENFRKLKRIKIAGNASAYILLEIEKFTPLDDNLCELNLLLFRPFTEQQANKLTQSEAGVSVNVS